MKDHTPWIVTIEGAHICRRCGAEEEVPELIPISKFIKQARRFIAEHKGCLRRARSGEGETE